MEPLRRFDLDARERLVHEALLLAVKISPVYIHIVLVTAFLIWKSAWRQLYLFSTFGAYSETGFEYSIDRV